MSKPSWRARGLRKTLGTFIAAPDTPLDDQRAAIERADRLPRPRGIAYGDTQVGGIPAIVATPKKLDAERHILYLHGGGYVIGSPKSHIAMAARLALMARASVTVPDYRLAPEHPYPAAIDDCVAVYRELLGEWDPSLITIAGDSAGGGATLAALCALRDAADPMPGAAYLLSPWTDLTASGSSVTTHAELDPMLRPESLGAFADQYVGEGVHADPGTSPLFADLSGLPPMLVQVGSDEILLSDSTRLAERARAAGVMVDLDIAPGMWHVYQAFAGMMPEATTALTEAAAFIRAKTPLPLPAL